MELTTISPHCILKLDQDENVNGVFLNICYLGILSKLKHLIILMRERDAELAVVKLLIKSEDLHGLVLSYHNSVVRLQSRYLQYYNELDNFRCF